MERAAAALAIHGDGEGLHLLLQGLRREHHEALLLRGEIAAATAHLLEAGRDALRQGLVALAFADQRENPAPSRSFEP